MRKNKAKQIVALTLVWTGILVGSGSNLLWLRSFWISEQLPAGKAGGAYIRVLTHKGECAIQLATADPTEDNRLTSSDFSRKKCLQTQPWPPSPYGKHADIVEMYGPIRFDAVSADAVNKAVKLAYNIKSMQMLTSANWNQRLSLARSRPDGNRNQEIEDRFVAIEQAGREDSLEQLKMIAQQAQSVRCQIFIPQQVVLVAIFSPWALSLAVAAMLDRMNSRVSRRRAAGLCVYCSYDLRGSPTRCPECGHSTSHP